MGRILVIRFHRHRHKIFVGVGHSLSETVGHDAPRMKTLAEFTRIETDGELIIRFGAGRLVRLTNGRLELRGGTPADHTAAKEWISLFHHEACFSVGRRLLPPGAGAEEG
jgi:hypothetical protein